MMSSSRKSSFTSHSVATAADASANGSGGGGTAASRTSSMESVYYHRDPHLRHPHSNSTTTMKTTTAATAGGALLTTSTGMVIDPEYQAVCSNHHDPRPKKEYDNEGNDNDDDDNPSSFLTLPTALNSTTTTTVVGGNNTISSSRSRTGDRNRRQKEQEQQEQRLVLLAKHPHANEQQVRFVMHQQHQRNQKAEIAARRRSHQFRQRQQQEQQLQEEQEDNGKINNSISRNDQQASSVSPKRVVSSSSHRSVHFQPASDDSNNRSEEIVSVSHRTISSTSTSAESVSQQSVSTMAVIPRSSSSSLVSSSPAVIDRKTLILNNNTLEDIRDNTTPSMSSFTLWQQASGEGTKEAKEAAVAANQRQHQLRAAHAHTQTHQHHLPPSHPQQQQQQRHHRASRQNESKGIFRLATGFFGAGASLAPLTRHNTASIQPTSSTGEATTSSSVVSSSSDNNSNNDRLPTIDEDGRSITTTTVNGGFDTKSHVSRSSLPSYTSEKTQKIHNLSPQMRRKRRNGGGNDNNATTGGLSCSKLFTTRYGWIILGLMVVVVVAVLVTIWAAVIDQDGSGNKSSSATAVDDQANNVMPFFPSPSNPDDFMPIMPVATPNSPSEPINSNAPTIAPTASVINSPTNPPSQSQTTATQPTSSEQTQPPTPLPTSEPTATPTQSPTTAPTLSPTPLPTASPTTTSPSFSPTMTQFEALVWVNQGTAISSTEQDERFGQSVVLSRDGNVLAIGAPDASVENGLDQSGMVQVYEWDASTEMWILRETLLGRNEGDQFGSSIAMSADGSIIAISEPTYNGSAGSRSGNVRVFGYTPFNGYSMLGTDLEGDDATDHFGIGLSMSSNGRRIAIGAPYHDNSSRVGNGLSLGTNRVVSGHAKVFEWSQQDERWILLGDGPLSGSNHLDWFGWSTDMNEDGTLVCVGAPRNLVNGGYVSCYELSDPGNPTSDWRLVGNTIRNDVQPLRYDDNFGSTIKISDNESGDEYRIAIGSPGKNVDALDSGMVVVYEYNPQEGSNAAWRQLGNAMVENPPGAGHQMGSSIDLQGSTLAVSAPSNESGGQVFVYQYQSDSDEWVQHPQPFKGSSSSNYGVSISLTMDGGMAVGTTETSGTSAGHVDIYQLAGR